MLDEPSGDHLAVARQAGSIDLLGFHATRTALLVVEVKTELVSAEATLRKHDEKARLAKQIASERFGWRSSSVSRLLVLPESTTARRRIGRHEALFARTYPLRGRTLAAWLHDPTGVGDGILFLPLTKNVGGRLDLTSRRRVHGTSTPDN